MHKIKVLIFLSFFLCNSHIIFAQGKATQFLSKLNMVHKQGRLMFEGKTQQIFLNADEKILDIGGDLYPLELIKFTYFYSNLRSPTKKYHTVHISCITEEKCITSVDLNGGLANGVYMYFKTKKDCYDFMNALSDLKKVLEE